MSEHRISEDQIYFLESREITVEDFDAPDFILDVGGGDAFVSKGDPPGRLLEAIGDCRRRE